MTENIEKIEGVKRYPHFTPSKSPNRRQRRKDSGTNKRGLHKLKDGQVMNLIIDNKLRFLHYKQMIPIKNKSQQIIGYRKIIHTRYQN